MQHITQERLQVTRDFIVQDRFDESIKMVIPATSKGNAIERAKNYRFFKLTDSFSVMTMN